MIKQKRKPSRLSVHLFVLPLILATIGLFFVFESSSVRSFNEFGESFNYVKLQLLWIVLGAGIMLFVSFFNYHKLYYLSFLGMVTTIVLLFLVLVPSIGQSAGGARRWLDLGYFSLQPTELAKLSVIIYLSSWFNHRERKRFFSFLILLSVLMLLIILQPDMGTAIIIFLIGIAMYYLAGIELHYLLFLMPAAIVAFLILIKISPYRFQRVLAFFNPSLDPLGITYHINQILISLGSGGVFGMGLGISRQKYMFLPEAHTDSIFAIIGEEVGFVGSFIIILLFLYLMYLIFQVAEHAGDRFGKLLAGGIFAFFNFQILINLAGITNLLPLTGVPLPFISYGGSNMLVSFTLLGVLINISRQSPRTR